MRTRFRRPVERGSSATSARATPKASASAATQAAFARPASGASRTATRRASPWQPPTASRRARVELEAGARGRRKRVRVYGDPAALERRFGELAKPG